MTMGIEQFRNLTTDNTQLANRRLRVDGQEGMETLRAPQSRWGRFVDWIKGIGHGGVNQAKVEANNQARHAFYGALVKATNEDFAKQVIKANTGEDLDTFLNKGTGLKLSRIKDMLEISDDAQIKYQRANAQQMDDYVTKHLGRVVNTLSKSEHSQLGFPDLKPNDPDVQRAFRELVTSHKDYGHRQFTVDELDIMANQAVNRAVEAKKARFDEQYSYLAKLDVPHAHDLETFFNSVDKDLDNNKTSYGQVQNSAKGWIRGVMGGLSKTGERLAKMEFDPKDVHNEIRRTKHDRDDLAGRLNVEPMGLWRVELRTAEKDVEAMLQDDPVLWGNVKGPRGRSQHDHQHARVDRAGKRDGRGSGPGRQPEPPRLARKRKLSDAAGPGPRLPTRLERHLREENIVVDEQDRKDIVSDFRKTWRRR